MTDLLRNKKTLWIGGGILTVILIFLTIRGAKKIKQKRAMKYLLANGIQEKCGEESNQVRNADPVNNIENQENEEEAYFIHTDIPEKKETEEEKKAKEVQQAWKQRDEEIGMMKEINSKRKNKKPCQ